MFQDKLLVVESPLESVEAALTECFASDPELLERWHIQAPATLEACVKRTVEDIQTSFNLDVFRFFQVFLDKELIAYWGTEYGNYLNLIFVKPAYRNREFMAWFWSEVQGSLENTFFTAVYERNLPAILFYTRRSGTPFKRDIEGQSFVVFAFDKENVMQTDIETVGV